MRADPGVEEELQAEYVAMAIALGASGALAEKETAFPYPEGTLHTFKRLSIWSRR
jgi:hypothetical protein